MSEYFDEIQAQLMERCAQGDHHRRLTRRRWRTGVSAVALVASAAIVAAVVVLAVGLTPRARAPRPPAGPRAALLTRPQQRRVTRTIDSATASVLNSPRCQDRTLDRSVRDHAPSSAWRSVIGALRSPAAAADTQVQHLIIRIVDGAFVKFIRVARVTPQALYYVVPVRAFGAITPGCLERARSGLARVLPAVPRVLRGAVHTQGLRKIDLYAPHPGVALVSTDREGTCRQSGSESPLPATCVPVTDTHLSQFAHQGIFTSTISPSLTSRIIGLVPDGVAVIQIHYSADRAVPHAVSVTAPVIHNIVITQVPRGDVEGFARMTMVWRAGNGRVIGTITQHTQRGPIHSTVP